MTVRVLWHGRVVGTLGADSPAEIAHRCIVEDLTSAQEEAMADLLRGDTAEDLVWGLVTERFKDWSAEDFFTPAVERALDCLMEDPCGECDDFTFRLPEGRAIWWSVCRSGVLLPAEGATPEALAEAMVREDRRAAAHFAVSHYLARLHHSDSGDACWVQSLALGLAAGDERLLASRTADILRGYWYDFMEGGFIGGTVYSAGNLSLVEPLPQTPSDDTEAI